MFFKSLGDVAASGLGEVVRGRTGGDAAGDSPAVALRSLLDGELLRLRVCDPGVTVSNALPIAEFEFGKV